MALFEQLFPARSIQRQADHYSWAKLWLGLYLNNLILPVNMLITYWTATVTWGGHIYIKCTGRVQKRVC